MSAEHHHDPFVHSEVPPSGGVHFWLTCGEWRHDPASNDPDDKIRWAEWQRALDAHLTEDEP